MQKDILENLRAEKKGMVYVGHLFQVSAKDAGELPWGLAVSEPNVNGDIELLRVIIPSDHNSHETPAETITLPNHLLPFPASLSFLKRFCLKAETLTGDSVAVPQLWLEQVLKNMVLLETRRYHQYVHVPVSRKVFVPSQSRIPFAGRVYDEREMMNLVESSLDFYLTGSTFERQFCRKLAHMLSSLDLPPVMVHTANSGSSANLLALSSLLSPQLGDDAVHEGDEVITIAAGFPTTVAPIVQNRLIPVFVDVQPGTYNIDPSQIEESLTERTRVIFIAHTLGMPFDLDQVLEIAARHKLWVIEDNCDALGAEYRLSKSHLLFRGKKVAGRGYTGTFGHVATTSFYPAHHITMGEGGAVYTSDSDLLRIMASFRDWGRDCWCMPGKDNTCGKRFQRELGRLPYGYDHKYTYSHLGYNLKITDMQAAVGVAQMDKLPSFIKARRKHWQMLYDGLNDLEDAFLLPYCPPSALPSPFGFVLTVRDHLNRDEVTSCLEENQIQTRNIFAGNILRQPAFTSRRIPLRIRDSSLLDSMSLTEDHYQRLPVTEKLMRKTFWVGVYPGLTGDMITFMIKKIRESVSRNSGLRGRNK